METEVLSGSINEFSCSSKVSLPHHSKSNQIIYAGKEWSNMTELIIISNKTKMKCLLIVSRCHTLLSVYVIISGVG